MLEARFRLSSSGPGSGDCNTKRGTVARSNSTLAWWPRGVPIAKHRYLLVAAVGVSLLLAACQNVVESSGVYYNTGLASASNNVLLANIIRAAKGYPTYYSAVGDYSGSLSTSSSPTLSADASIDALSQTSLSADLAPSVSRDRNANVSSLETQDFVRAMNSEISPELFAFLLRSRHNAHLNLVFAMVVDTITLTPAEFQRVLLSAQDICHNDYTSLRLAQRGVCDNFTEVLAAAACEPDFVAGPGVDTMKLRSDPTNPCAFSQFRAFAEAIMVNEPRFSQDEDKNITLQFTHRSSSIPSLAPTPTGLLLRSPNELIHYLGAIVRTASRTDWTPRLTSEEGDSVPIFVIRTGADRGRATAAARVDGEEYWIAAQDLNKKKSDFSNHALAIVKDFHALNTSDSALPSNPTVVITR